MPWFAQALERLNQRLEAISFGPPVTHVYNPGRYAAEATREYVIRFGSQKKKVLFLGMNPGPFGMAQTGVPFGEVKAVRDWIGIQAPIGKPEVEHPARPITGFDCKRSEVSGKRLWGLFAQRYGKADAFFKDHFVWNFCPLLFMEASGKNRTPDKLPQSEQTELMAACDDFLSDILEVLQPEWLVGVGAYAEGRAKIQQTRFPDLKVGKIPHPSPANPLANKDWPGAATAALCQQGIWNWHFTSCL